jgi:hypothetical protein
MINRDPMKYPDFMNIDDIMEFEYEYSKLIDIERNEGQFWAINAEMQILSQETSD